MLTATCYDGVSALREAATDCKFKYHGWAACLSAVRGVDLGGMRRDHGFTLIEIMVVLAILGVALGLIIGRGPMRSRGLEARAAAGALAQTLRAARAQAIATDHDVTVAIDPSRHVFAIEGGPPRRLAADLPIAVLPPALRGPGPVRLIRFSADGSATGGQVTVGAGRARLDISVEWLTGQVRVSDAR